MVCLKNEEAVFWRLKKRAELCLKKSCMITITAKVL